MVKKQKCVVVLVLGLLVALQVHAAEHRLLTIVSPEECARKLQPQHQYLARRHFFNELQGWKWTVTQLRKWFKPLCVQCLFSCALEETHLVESRQRFGGVALSELSEQARTEAKTYADGEVVKFFDIHLSAANLEMVKASELWQGTVLAQEPVSEEDVADMVEEVIRAIIVPEPESAAR